MGRASRIAVILGALVGTVVPMRDAQALGWIRLPNGKLAYQMDYTSSAVFTCSKWIVLGNCQSTGNAVTLTNGSQQITYSWAPVTSVLTTGFFRSPSYNLGSIQRTVSGGGPMGLPTLANPKGPMFSMMLYAPTGMPTPYSEEIYYSFVLNQHGGLRVGGNSTWRVLGGANAPNGANGSIWMHASMPADLPTEAGETELMFNTGIATPEPASLLLLTTGLAGLAGVARRRKRRSASTVRADP